MSGKQSCIFNKTFRNSLKLKIVFIRITEFISGIVKFETSFTEIYGNNITLSDFVVIPDQYFYEERTLYTEIDHSDGKQITFYIRGYDVMGSSAEDNVTIWFDKSPPLIENLWLTRGDNLNISVHNVTGLDELT